jgi:uncharacterized damage-inducible protein DinB
MAKDELSLLLTMLEQAFDQKSWHGTNLKGSIKGLDVNTAAWRPFPQRHNIWEIVVHAAYWKYIVRRRLRGEAKGTFPLKGSNWILRPSAAEADLEAWKSDVKLLEAAHRQMLEAVRRLSPREIHLTPPGSKVSNLSLLTGVAAHDLYHAGQIQLLKRLAQQA